MLAHRRRDQWRTLRNQVRLVVRAELRASLVWCGHASAYYATADPLYGRAPLYERPR